MELVTYIFIPPRYPIAVYHGFVRSILVFYFCIRSGHGGKL